MQVLRIGVVVAALMGLVGCAVDQLHIVDHPDSAGPGDTITVTFADYFVLGSMPTLLEPIVRDSIHFAMGLPAGWKVAAMDYYVADELRINTLATPLDSLGEIDSAALAAMIADSLAAYDERRAAMQADAAVARFMGGQSIPLGTDSLNGAITVGGESVEQWFGYSAAADIRIEQPDTVLSVSEASSSFSTMVGMSDTMVSSLASVGVDSVGVSAVPVFMQAKLVVGSATGTHHLVYYSKTGPLPSDLTPATQEETMTWLAGAYFDYLRNRSPSKPAPNDKGAAGFFPFVVDEPGFAAYRRGGLSEHRGAVATRMDRGMGRVLFEHRGAGRIPAGVLVYSAAGKLVTRLRPTVSPTALGWAASWDVSGQASGAYFVEVPGSGLAGAALQLVR